RSGADGWSSGGAAPGPHATAVSGDGGERRHAERRDRAASWRTVVTWRRRLRAIDHVRLGADRGGGAGGGVPRRADAATAAVRGDRVAAELRPARGPGVDGARGPDHRPPAIRVARWGARRRP